MSDFTLKDSDLDPFLIKAEYCPSCFSNETLGLQSGSEVIGFTKLLWCSCGCVFIKTDEGSKIPEQGLVIFQMSSLWEKS